jgi:hypothetical protein
MVSVMATARRALGRVLREHGGANLQVRAAVRTAIWGAGRVDGKHYLGRLTRSDFAP